MGTSTATMCYQSVNYPAWMGFSWNALVNHWSVWAHVPMALWIVPVSVMVHRNATHVPPIHLCYCHGLYHGYFLIGYVVLSEGINMFNNNYI